jgi:hypothetical protein
LVAPDSRIRASDGLCPRWLIGIGATLGRGTPQIGGDWGERLVRAVFFVLAVAILAAGCSDDKPVADPSQASSEEILKKNCADPKWKEQNLGLWYSVCRQPLRW